MIQLEFLYLPRSKAGRLCQMVGLRLVDAGRLTRRELAEKLGLSERTMYRRLKALGGV